jgi:hypothetical protein
MTMRRRAAKAVAILAVLAAASCSTGNAATSLAPEGSGDVAGERAGGTSSSGRAGDATECAGITSAGWDTHPDASDAVAAIVDDVHPLPPIPDLRRPLPPSVIWEYPSPEDFLAQSNVVDQAARLAAMTSLGYSGGVEAQFDIPPDIAYDAQALRFADAERAAAYFDVHMEILCDFTSSASLLSDDGWIAYENPAGGAHGIFVFGASEVSLTICECVPGDRLQMIRDWYQRWVEELGGGSPPGGESSAS